MQRHDAWWFPDGETQLPRVMAAQAVRIEGRLVWQYHKYAAALSLCTQRRLALDIGAHVGLWSYWMAQDFLELHAFEPVAAHRACWYANVTALNATMHSYALGATKAAVQLVTPSPETTGGTYVAPETTAFGDLQHPLDSFGFAEIDLVKIDCEGYEPAVIDGAVETLRRTRPVVVVEQHLQPGPSRYGFGPTAAVDRLTALGMSVRTTLGSDVILEWGG